MTTDAKLSYTVDEAAAAVGVSRRTVYALVQKGELQSFKWAGRTLIRRDVLEQALDRASGGRAP